MMTPDQAKTVSIVYNHLMSKEERGWDGLDDYLDWLEYLEDDQLERECQVLYLSHKNKSVRCQEVHDKKICFVPLLVDAVCSILDLYKETKQLHIKNKYILQYYLAMTQANIIIAESSEV